MLTKGQLRNKILDKLKLQKEEDRNRKSAVIQRKLFATKLFKKAKNVMFYISFGKEVNTYEMIKEAFALGKKVIVPVSEKRNRVQLRPALLEDHIPLVRGPYGVYEPLHRRYFAAQELDLVVVPGVAFDKKGNRLGRGKGCYDRFLEKLPTRTVSVGLAFDFQIVPYLPCAPNDVGVNRVIYS